MNPGRASSVKVLQFQTLVHPANYSAEPIAFHDEMPVTRLAAEANRPDLALVAGTGQLVAHLSHLVIGVESNVTPMHCSGPVPGPVISGEPQPCIQAAKFDSAGRTTYVPSPPATLFTVGLAFCLMKPFAQPLGLNCRCLSHLSFNP